MLGSPRPSQRTSNFPLPIASEQQLWKFPLARICTQVLCPCVHA